MSRPFRAIRSLIAFTSLAGLGAHPICQSANTATTTETTHVSHSVDSMSTRYSRAGLIRIIQEDVATSDQANLSGSDDKRIDVRPSLNQDRKGIIELGPLGMPNTSLYGIGTGVRPEDVTIDRLPPSQPLPVGETRSGGWDLQAKQWVPGGFCHQPLYFEDPMLERHGHSRFPCVQPVLSGIRFFGTVPILPYLATLRHPLDDVHTLGAYQPGTAAPVLRYRAHYDPIALRNQFLAMAGTAVAVP